MKRERVEPAKKREVVSVSVVMKKDLTNKLNAIKRKTVFTDKINELKKLDDWAKTKTIPEELQRIAYADIKALYAKRPVTDAAAMDAFKKVLEVLAKSKLLSDEQKAEVTGTLIPDIAKQ